MDESDPECNKRGVPVHLHRLGRAADQNFLPTEKLYVRFRMEERKIKSILNFKRQSCNRSTLCEGGADDVLFDAEHGGRYENCGVMAATVEGLQKISAKHPNEPKVYTLSPDHQPTQCNFAHSEIVSQENGNPAPDIKPSLVKKQIREALSEIFLVELPRTMAGEKFKVE